MEIHELVEIAASLICTACMLYKPSVINRWLIWFLWLTVLVELVGRLASNMELFHNLMYNVFNGIEFIFYFIFFFKITDNSIKKKGIKISILVFISFFVFNFLLGQGAFRYNDNTTVFGSSILILFCLLQYFETINSDSPKYSKWSIFFIVSGIFIFYTGTFRIYVSFSYLAQNMRGEIVWLYKFIVSNLNVILYGMLSTGLIFDIVEDNKSIKVALKKKK